LTKDPNSIANKVADALMCIRHQIFSQVLQNVQNHDSIINLSKEARSLESVKKMLGKKSVDWPFITERPDTVEMVFE